MDDDIRALNRMGLRPIDLIGPALIACGYCTLDAQAKALGLNRATTWTIVKAKHKMGRLSLKTRITMLRNPHLPDLVRAVLAQYEAANKKVCYTQPVTARVD
jgi:hypothetical protein